MNNLQHQNQSSKGLTTLKIIIVVLVLVLVSGAAYGTWKFFSKSEPTLLPEEPTTKPTTPETSIQPEPELTADWETYQSSKMGFSIKYPPGWKLFSEEPREKYTAMHLDHIDKFHRYTGVYIRRGTAYSEELGKELSLEEIAAMYAAMYEEDSTTKQPEVKNVKKEQMILDGVPAIKFFYITKEEEQNCDILALIENDLFYIGCHSKQEECESTFNQMLSTFRFLE